MENGSIGVKVSQSFQYLLNIAWNFSKRNVIHVAVFPGLLGINLGN